MVATHGAKPAQSGKWFNALHYEVDKDTGLIDYQSVEKLAIENKPKLIIAGEALIQELLILKDLEKFVTRLVLIYLLIWLTSLV